MTQHVKDLKKKRGGEGGTCNTTGSTTGAVMKVVLLTDIKSLH